MNIMELIKTLALIMIEYGDDKTIHIDGDYQTLYIVEDGENYDGKRLITIELYE